MRTSARFGRHALCRSVLLGAGLFFVAVVPAGGATRAWPEGSTPVATVEGLTQGPQLVDSRIAWLDSSYECISGCRDSSGDFTERETYRLRISRPRGKPSVLYTATSKSGAIGGADSFGGSLRFALSGSFLAALATSSFDGREDSSFDLRLAAGPRPRSAGSKTLQRITSCSGTGFSGPGGAFALSDALLVHDATPCTGADGVPSRIAFRDLSTGRRRVEDLPEDRVLDGAAAAGRFVAVSLAKRVDFDDPEPEHFVALFDSERPGAIATAPAGRNSTSFDVQADGRVAICSDGGQLSTFSPTAPEPRDLGRCEGSVKIARDRVVFRAPEGDLEVSDLAGQRETIAPLGSVITPFGLDFDGLSVAYAVPRCVGGTEILRTTATTRARARPYAKCPAFVRSPARVRVRGKGRTSFGLRCPRGCTGFFGLHGGRYQIASGFFERRPGRKAVRMRLDGYGQRILRRSGSLRAKLTVVVYDRDGERSRVRRTLRLTR